MCAYGDSLYAFFVFRRYETISANNNKDLLINEEIKAPEVRVIGPSNEQVGIMKIDDARAFAYNNGVDLVLIAANATPPVCRAIDYGKFCFERDKREKEAKKKQVIVKVKEVQLSCRISTLPIRVFADAFIVCPQATEGLKAPGYSYSRLPDVLRSQFIAQSV